MNMLENIVINTVIANDISQKISTIHECFLPQVFKRPLLKFYANYKNKIFM